jgi:crossover junction endodeoxyribonuclease RuvC
MMIQRSGVLGLDLSVTGTGWYFLGNTEASGLFSIPKSIQKSPDAHFSRLDWLAVQLAALLDQWTPAIVVIEDYSYGSKGSSLYTIAEWGGVARLELFRKKFRTLAVAPLTLKQFACPEMKATTVKKEHVMMGVLKRWGREISDNNVADAFVLAAIGQSFLRAWGDFSGSVKAFSRENLLATQEKALQKVGCLLDFPLVQLSEKAPPKRGI